MKGSTTTDKVLNIRFLNDDAAVVVSETAILFPGETEVPEDRLVVASWMLTRQDGKWLLAAYQLPGGHEPGLRLLPTGRPSTIAAVEGRFQVGPTRGESPLPSTTTRLDPLALARGQASMSETWSWGHRTTKLLVGGASTKINRRHQELLRAPGRASLSVSS
ncbi:SgcJ/EcaC family oxidoreductase [Streptomyces sp. MMS24-I31]|uniref:SgcJ/EcaC family oxidoreductase n=1 Tax=Streptomyces sp. MMS24-I31 TaxID=3351563 RepID=UPI003896BCD0